MFQEMDLTIRETNNTFTFAGSLACFDFTDFENYFTVVFPTIRDEIILFDFYNLEHISPTGIKALSRVISKCPKKLKVYINKKRSWQELSLQVLRSLKPDGLEIV